MAPVRVSVVVPTFRRPGALRSASTRSSPGVERCRIPCRGSHRRRPQRRRDRGREGRSGSSRSRSRRAGRASSPASTRASTPRPATSSASPTTTPNRSPTGWRASSPASRPTRGSAPSAGATGIHVARSARTGPSRRSGSSAAGGGRPATTTSGSAARDVDVLKGVNLSLRGDLARSIRFDPRLLGIATEHHSELPLCLAVSGAASASSTTPPSRSTTGRLRARRRRESTARARSTTPPTTRPWLCSITCRPRAAPSTSPSRLWSAPAARRGWPRACASA